MSGHAQCGEQDARQRWQKPFARLIRHSIERVLYGGNDAGAGELDFGIGAMLALLAAPGGFAAIFMVEKYGSLFRFLRHQSMLDGYAASLPDEYFFIVLAMIVTGAVAIWKWDALIPDRRDYVNLAPLPIPAKNILYANLTALLLLAAVLALDVNAASSILFPLVVCGSQISLRYLAVFFATHLLSVVLASVFSFFCVLAVLGVLMAALPYRLFRRCSVYVRCGMIAFMMAILSASFVMTDLVENLSRSSRPLVQLLSPLWFLGLCQHLRGLADPAFLRLAKIAVFGSVAALIFALGAYALSYRRCFTQSSESIANFASVGGSIRHGTLSRLADLFLRTPFERACFRFTLKTLFRSENHTLIVGGFAGVGIVLASEALFQAAPTSRTPALPSAAALSVPLIVIYFLLLGLRFSFEIPVMLRANWIFRLRTNPDTNECAGLARKIMLAVLLPLLLCATLPAYALRYGWEVGWIHAAIIAGVSLLLIEILLARFRKIPFTCSAPQFKSNLLVLVFFYLLGFFAFTSGVPAAEEAAFENPFWYLVLIPALALIWLALERYRGELTYLDKRLIFEERPEPAVEVLDLTFSR
jgi:hypothetical protein